MDRNSNKFRWLRCFFGRSNKPGVLRAGTYGLTHERGEGAVTGRTLLRARRSRKATQDNRTSRDRTLLALGAPWVPSHATVATVPGDGGWIPAPSGVSWST